jgi:hypothetical protein
MLGHHFRRILDGITRLFIGTGLLQHMGCEGAVRPMRTSLCYPNPTYPLGIEKAAPLGESGGATGLEIVPAGEGALSVEVVVD